MERENLSFIQHKSYGVACIQEVFFGCFVTGSSLKDPELVYSRSFEMNQQQGVKFKCRMDERFACI